MDASTTPEASIIAAELDEIQSSIESEGFRRDFNLVLVALSVLGVLPLTAWAVLVVFGVEWVTALTFALIIPVLSLMRWRAAAVRLRELNRNAREAQDQLDLLQDEGECGGALPTTLRLTFLLVAGSLLASCDSAPDAGPDLADLRVERDTAGAFEVVTIAGDLPALGLRTVNSWGSEELDGSGALGPEDFSWVSSAAITRSGDLFIADLERQEVLVFDPEEGSFVRSLGRGGSGPGEFETLYSIAPFGPDVLAMDIGNGRTTRLTEEGRWAEQWRAAGRLVASPVDFRLYPVGPNEVYQWAYSMDEGLEVPVWRRYTADRDPDEMPRFTPRPKGDFPDRVTCRMGRGFSWFPHPLSPAGLSHPLPGRRAVVASTESFAFAVLDAAGDTIRVVRRAVAPLPTSDVVWSQLESEFEEWLADKDRSRCEPAELPRPDMLPVIMALMVDVTGRVWVERRLDDGTEWEVFESDGTPVGSLPGFNHDRERNVPFLGEDYLIWMTRDEMDLPRVHLAAWVR